MDSVTIKFFGLSKLGFGIVENGGGCGAGEIFVGETAVAAGNIDKVVAMGGQKFAQGKAVGRVFVFAVGVFPEDFFVVITVVIGDDIFASRGWGSLFFHII